MQELLSLPSYAHSATSVDVWAAVRAVSATLVVGNTAGHIITWSLEVTPTASQVFFEVSSLFLKV